MDMTALTSETQLSLLERLKSQDETAWVEFTNKYAGVMESWCRKWNLQASDMQDVVQDTLLAVMKGISSFERQRVGSFRAWMKTIAWRSWKEGLAKAERQKGYELLSGQMRQANACEELEAAFDAIAVQELVEASIQRVRGRIEERTWEAFRMTALESNPVSEVAGTLEMNVDAVYAARCRVQRMITREYKLLDQD